MRRNQIIRVWDVHRGMIFRHSDMGHVGVFIAITNPTPNEENTFYTFKAKDIATEKPCEFGAKYPQHQFHPHLEYVGEAAN